MTEERKLDDTDAQWYWEMGQRHNALGDACQDVARCVREVNGRRGDLERAEAALNGAKRVHAKAAGDLDRGDRAEEATAKADAVYERNLRESRSIPHGYSARECRETVVRQPQEAGGPITTPSAFEAYNRHLIPHDVSDPDCECASCTDCACERCV